MSDYLHGFPNASIVREAKRPPPCKSTAPRRPAGCEPADAPPPPPGKLDSSPILNPHFLKLFVPQYTIRTLIGKDLGAKADPFDFRLPIEPRHLDAAVAILEQFPSIVLLAGWRNASTR